MKNNLVRSLGVVLPILGLIVTIWDSINQSKVAELDRKEFEEELVQKYGLKENQDV